MTKEKKVQRVRYSVKLPARLVRATAPREWDDKTDYSNPNSRARRAAWVRSRAPSFWRMLVT